MELNELDWTRLGKELRESADDAHDGQTPSVNIAYSFLLDNPESFLGMGSEEWPADMPQEPNIELIAAYYRVGESPALAASPTSAVQDEAKQ